MNPHDPNFMRRVLNALSASLPSFGRPRSGDEIHLDLIEKEEGSHPHRPRYRVPLHTAGEWFFARLTFHTDRDEAVLIRPGAPTLDALAAIHRSMPLPPHQEATTTPFQPIARI